MGMFIDAAGRRWVIELNSHALSRVRREAGLNPRDAIDFTALLSPLDPPRAASILFALVAPFARDAGIGPNEFRTAIADESILTAAREAVADAQTDQPLDEPNEPPRRSPFRKPS